MCSLNHPDEAPGYIKNVVLTWFFSRFLCPYRRAEIFVLKGPSRFRTGWKVSSFPRSAGKLMNLSHHITVLTAADLNAKAAVLLKSPLAVDWSFDIYQNNFEATLENQQSFKVNVVLLYVNVGANRDSADMQLCVIQFLGVSINFLSLYIICVSIQFSGSGLLSRRVAEVPVQKWRTKECFLYRGNPY